MFRVPENQKAEKEAREFLSFDKKSCKTGWHIKLPTVDCPYYIVGDGETNFHLAYDNEAYRLEAYLNGRTSRP